MQYTIRRMFKLTMLVCFLAGAFADDQLPFEVAFEWNYINYNWPSTDALVQALASGDYIPKNIAITGIKLWRHKMYLTTPRFKKGVPVTLAVTSARPINGITDPLLDPYPNWDMQTEGDCRAFQYVQSMEIDPLGRMWVLDTGRTETLNEKPAIRCPPRLVILDLENNGSVLRTYVFPDEVTPHESVLLDDIAIDHEDGGMAYITDNQAVDPGIIVYSLKNNTSWKVRDDGSMRAQAEAVNFEVDGVLQSAPIHLDGITLSPPGPNRLLYYLPLSSFHVYTIPVSILKNPPMENISEYVNDLGRKTWQSDGLLMSNQGVLYFENLTDAGIVTWDSKNSKSFVNDLKEVFRDPVRGQWPDTFSFDEYGYIWYTANNLPTFKADNIDITKPNYRIFRAWVQQKSYQYLEDGTAPKFPVIAGATDRRSNIGHCVLLPRDETRMLRLTTRVCHLAEAFAVDQLPFEVVFEWNYMNYNWPSIDSLVQALASGRYIPQNNLLTGIKIWKDKIYLSIPRLKDGVPVTLAVTSATPVDGVTNPLLDPYPSWEMQTVDDCVALQSVQSMEIDPLGRLWAIDTGRTETAVSTMSCPPRLVILDLENNGKILLSYVFPEEVAPSATTYLNDIVLDHDDGGTVFITDSGNVDPGIIVYSLKENRSWKVRHNASMLAQEEAVDFVVGGTLMVRHTSIDGISLSPPGPNRMVYYTPLSSFHVYSVPAWVLKNSSLVDIDEYVTDLGRKSSQTDGMVITTEGVLYLGLLGYDSIASWNTVSTKSFVDDLTEVFKDSVRGQWPDTFAIDEDGHIWYTANALQNFFAGIIDIRQPNYRVFKAPIEQRSYQYLQDGTAPELPEITAADDQ